jgi:hypothetical protein
MTSSTGLSTDSDKLTKWVIISTTVAVVALIVAAVALRDARKKQNEIVLADDHGRPRVRIAATSNGGTIELLDERGRARIALRQAGDASSISVHRKEAGDPEDYAIQLLVDETKLLNNFTMREPSTHTLVKLSGSDGGSLGLHGKSGEVVLFGGGPIRSGLRVGFGMRTAELAVSELDANMTFRENDVRMIELSQSSIKSALELAPPGQADEAVSLSAYKEGSSLYLHRSPRSALSPVQLSVGEDGGRITVNGKQLGVATR